MMENDSEKSTPISDDIIPTQVYVEFQVDSELNLSCCVLMLDALLKQVSYIPMLHTKKLIIFNIIVSSNLEKFLFKIIIYLIEFI